MEGIICGVYSHPHAEERNTVEREWREQRRRAYRRDLEKRRKEIEVQAPLLTRLHSEANSLPSDPGPKLSHRHSLPLVIVCLLMGVTSSQGSYTKSSTTISSEYTSLTDVPSLSGLCITPGGENKQTEEN